MNVDACRIRSIEGTIKQLQDAYLYWDDKSVVLLTPSTVYPLSSTYTQLLSNSATVFDNARIFAAVVNYKHILYRLDENSEPLLIHEFPSLVAFDTRLSGKYTLNQIYYV